MILRGSRFASWSAAVSGSLRVVAAALLAAAAVTALLPGSVAAAGACTFAINGVPLDAAATQDQAIVVGIEDDASLTASGPGPLGNVVVQAEFWPITVPAQSGFTDQSEAEGTVSPGGRGAVQGLYHVVVTSDNPACLPSVGWVRIVGAGPFDSIPGKVGGVLALVGIGVLLLALRSALAGGGGRRVGFIGGALVGLGALIVAQQAGAAAIDARSAVIWTALPATVGAAVMHGVGLIRPSTTGSVARDVDVRYDRTGSVTISNPSAGGDAGPGTFHPVPTTQAQPSVRPTIQPEARELPTPVATVGGVAATTRAEPPARHRRHGKWGRPRHPDGPVHDVRHGRCRGHTPQDSPWRRTTVVARPLGRPAAPKPGRQASEAPGMRRWRSRRTCLRRRHASRTHASMPPTRSSPRSRSSWWWA